MYSFGIDVSEVLEAWDILRKFWHAIAAQEDQASFEALLTRELFSRWDPDLVLQAFKLKPRDVASMLYGNKAPVLDDGTIVLLSKTLPPGVNVSAGEEGLGYPVRFRKTDSGWRIDGFDERGRTRIGSIDPWAALFFERGADA